MRSYSTATLAALQTDAGGIISHGLLWVVGKNRSTGFDEALGIWTGSQDQVFSIDGDDRTYYGAGALLAIPPIVYTRGLEFQKTRVRLAPASPAVIQMISTYEPRQGRAEIHRALFDVSTNALVDEPHRMFKGRIDEVTTQIDQEAVVEVVLAPSARDLTRPLSRRKSDETHQLGYPDDRIRRYADVSGKVEIKWGEK